MKNNYELITIYKYHDTFTPVESLICKNGIILSGKNKGKRLNDVYNKAITNKVPFSSKKKGLYTSMPLEKSKFRNKEIDLTDLMIEYKIVDQDIYSLEYTIEKHECYEERDKKSIANKLMDSVYASCIRKKNTSIHGYEEVNRELDIVSSSIKRNGNTPDNSLKLKILQSKLESKE